MLRPMSLVMARECIHMGHMGSKGPYRAVWASQMLLQHRVGLANLHHGESPCMSDMHTMSKA